MWMSYKAEHSGPTQPVFLTIHSAYTDNSNSSTVVLFPVKKLLLGLVSKHYILFIQHQILNSEEENIVFPCWIYWKDKLSLSPRVHFSLVYIAKQNLLIAIYFSY